MAEMRSPRGSMAHSVMTKAQWRILPLLLLGYLVAFVDRANVGFAATRMNQDLGFSATIYGLGGGLFFLGYALLEVPSNMLTVRYGARKWIARITITWGLIAVAMMAVRTPVQFYVLRFLLGAAEAGFFPAITYYMAHWFPMAHRGRAMSRFYTAGPLANVVMGGLSGWLMGFDGRAGLHGWQWLFLVEGLPSVLIGLLVLRFLPDSPGAASWLTGEEKSWLEQELARDAARIGEPVRHDIWTVMKNPLVLQLGAIGFLTIGAFYSVTLSAPTLLMRGSGLDITHVGYIVSLGGIGGALGMLFTGWLSDRRGERFAVLLACVALVGLAYQGLGMANSPLATIMAYLLFAAAYTTVTLGQVLLWGDILHVRILAIGCAAANSINQAGGFVGPYLWGIAKDATGGFRAGLIACAVAMLLAGVLIVILRQQVVARTRSLAPAI